MKNYLKFNKLNTSNPLHLVLIGLILYFGFQMIRKSCMSSGYRLSPATYDTTVTAEQVPGGLFGLPYKMDCVPGDLPTSSYYTKGLSPGGICGGQKYVESQASDYVITGSNGGAMGKGVGNIG
jgi:hypothetical protein